MIGLWLARTWPEIMKNKKININKSPSSQAASGWARPLMWEGSSLTGPGIWDIIGFRKE
jgi:hypothetical protein